MASVKEVDHGPTFSVHIGTRRRHWLTHLLLPCMCATDGDHQVVCVCSVCTGLLRRAHRHGTFFSRVACYHTVHKGKRNSAVLNKAAGQHSP